MDRKQALRAARAFARFAQAERDKLAREDRLMPQSLEFPVAVAKAFARDIRAYFAESDGLKRDEIAARQLHALNELRRPRDKKLRFADVKTMFLEMQIRVKSKLGGGLPAL